MPGIKLTQTIEVYTTAEKETLVARLQGKMIDKSKQDVSEISEPTSKKGE